MLASVAAVLADRNLHVLRSTDAATMLSDWIATGNFAVHIQNAGIYISPHQPASLASAVSSDSLRLLLAGRETLNAIESSRQGDSIHAAWSSIQMYYAAFYYTSAALRLVGISHSFLQLQELAKLRLILSAIGQTSLPSSGLYRLQFDQQATIVDFRKVPHGTHEALWLELRDYIDGLKTRLSSIQDLTDRERSEAERQLNLISEATVGLNAQPNISSTRNDVQYRQKFSCWYPNARQVRRFHVTDRISQALAPDFSPAAVIQGQENYDAFFTKSLAICGFMHQVVREVSETSATGTLGAKYRRYDKALAA